MFDSLGSHQTAYVAQLVERRIEDPGVGSSTLSVGTKILRAASDNGSTSALHAEGRGSIPRRSTKNLGGISHWCGKRSVKPFFNRVWFDSTASHQ